MGCGRAHRSCRLSTAPAHIIYSVKVLFRCYVQGTLCQRIPMPLEEGWLACQMIGDRTICCVVSACDSPFLVSTDTFELPWMRPSAFQVLCPCLTNTTLLASFMDGRGIGEESNLSFKSVNSSTSDQRYSCFRKSVSTAAAEHICPLAFPVFLSAFNPGNILEEGREMIDRLLLLP